MQATISKVPTSILKRPSPISGSETETNHRRKGERRVRFREPETTVHGENTDSFVNFLQLEQPAESQKKKSISLYKRKQRALNPSVTQESAWNTAVKPKTKIQ